MNRVPWWLTLMVFSVVSLATLGWMAIGDESLLGPTGSMGDDVYFENIAFHLAKGEGIRFDFTDPEWRRPYRDANTNGQYDWILFLKAKGLTTSRAPGFPLVVALIYRVCGRQFGIVRAVNALLLVAAITLLLHSVFRWYGVLAGTLALVTISLDCFVLRTAGQFMTEALGTAVICVVFLGCVRLSRPTMDANETSFKGWLVVGLLFGFGALVRANLNAWLPLIGVTVAIIIVWRWWLKQNWLLILKSGIAFFIGVLLVASPYWVRNCQVTSAFAPLGTSGSFGLVGGYCDQAYDDFGNWSIEASVDSQRITMAKPGFFELPLAQQELWMGQSSVHLAKQWIVENWTKMPALIGMKMISHLGFYRQPLVLQILNGLIMFGALIGCYVTRRSFGFWVFAILSLSLITTSLAWPHYGRYSIPLRPLIHCASAIGTVAFWKLVLGKRQ